MLNHDTVNAGISSPLPLKTNAERQHRHHVGVRPSSRVNIREVEQKGRDETHLLVQGKVQAYADRDQKGGIGRVEVGMQKAEPPCRFIFNRLSSPGRSSQYFPCPETPI